MFGCSLLEVCSHLIRQKGNGYGWEEKGGIDGRKTIIKKYYMRKNRCLIKYKNRNSSINDVRMTLQAYN